MKINTYHIIGVMSGTSLDGIDLCYVRFQKNKNWKFDILNAETTPYTKEWLMTLGKIIEFGPEEIDRIDAEYSNYLAIQIKEYISRQNIDQIDAVCSHGHTVFHQPERQWTFQLGNLSSLSKILNKTVVCDFRIQDVELGGQGAPLVPIGDKLLFNNFDFCLNLGGFANISFDIDEERVAYDICPVNIVLNYFSRQLGKQFDNEGKIAGSGIVDPHLLNALNDLAYYKKSYPKSLGLEWVQSVVLPLIKSYKIPIANVLRTMVEHAAIQITNQINFKETASVLVTGGGAYHSFLMERLIELSHPEIIVPSKEIINYKEALIFGFLGVLKLRNETNCLKSVNGAKRDHSSGKIFHP